MFNTKNKKLDENNCFAISAHIFSDKEDPYDLDGLIFFEGNNILESKLYVLEYNDNHSKFGRNPEKTVIVKGLFFQSSFYEKVGLFIADSQHKKISSVEIVTKNILGREGIYAGYSYVPKMTELLMGKFKESDFFNNVQDYSKYNNSNINIRAFKRGLIPDRYYDELLDLYKENELS